METQNYFLRALNDRQLGKLGLLSERDRAAAHVYFRRGDTIYSVGDEVTHLYFMERTSISLIRGTPDGRYQVPIWSFDGTMVGAQIRFWLPGSLFEHKVRIASEGWKVPRERVISAVGGGDDLALARLILNWVHYFDHSIVKSAVCLVSHEIMPRFCRMLLALQIAMKGENEIPLSVAQIAEMLPGARKGVYDRAHELEDQGAIIMKRRSVELTDISILAATSCPCFDAITARRDHALAMKDEIKPGV